MLTLKEFKTVICQVVFPLKMKRPTSEFYTREKRKKEKRK